MKNYVLISILAITMTAGWASADILTAEHVQATDLNTAAFDGTDPWFTDNVNDVLLWKQRTTKTGVLSDWPDDTYLFACNDNGGYGDHLMLEMTLTLQPGSTYDIYVDFIANRFTDYQHWLVQGGLSPDELIGYDRGDGITYGEVTYQAATEIVVSLDTNRAGYRGYLGQAVADPVTGEVKVYIDDANVASADNNHRTQWGGVAYELVPGASNPSPADGATGVAIDVQLSWSAPTDITPTGYDVWFGTEPNAANAAYDMEKIISNQNVLTADPALHSTLTTDMDFLTTYYWQVDAYDSNTPPELTEGSLWSFTTAPDDRVPIVTPGSSFITWIDGLPQTLEAAVNDFGEGDIASVTWDIISGEGIAWNEDMQMLDRGVDGKVYTVADPNLLRDWIGTDSRNIGSDVLTLTLSGLPTGSYNWKSYHHDANLQGTQFDVTVNDSTGSTTTTGVGQSHGAVDPNTFEATISSDGSDVSLVFVGDDSQYGMFTMNGFELTGTGDPLMIDFSADPNFIMTGYQGYTATHEVAETFTTQAFTAFGTTVSVTPTWDDAPGLVVTSTGGTLLAPTATVDGTTAPKVEGTYTIEVIATDTAAQSDSATLEVQVFEDACAAAQADGASFSNYDVDRNCVVDLPDFAAFAAEWLDDINLNAPVAY